MRVPTTQSSQTTHNGHLFIPSRKDVYPYIGWGYGNTLMVEQGDDRLLACDVRTARACHRVTYKGVITLPNGHQSPAGQQAADLVVCGPRGDRTHNPRIKSPLLCQLS